MLRYLKALSPAKFDFLVSSIAVFFAYLATLYFNLSERFVAWAAQHEAIQLDEIPLMLLVAALAATWFAQRRIREIEAEVERRKQAEAQVTLLMQENQSLARHAMQAQEEERRRLVREIHDDLGQYLTAIRLDAAAIPKTGVKAITAHGKRIAAHTEHIQTAFKEIVHRMRPSALDAHGLIEALRLLINEWRKANPNITTHITLEDGGLELPEEVSIVAYRAVQEALTNITKHAKAKAVEILVSVNAPSQLLILHVKDDGVGSASNSSKSGFGLIGMRERVENLSGVLTIKSDKHHGLAITASIPIKIYTKENA